MQLSDDSKGTHEDIAQLANRPVTELALSMSCLCSPGHAAAEDSEGD